MNTTFREQREVVFNIPNGTTHMIYEFHCEDCHHEFATEPCSHFSPQTHPWQPQLCYSITYAEEPPELIKE